MAILSFFLVILLAANHVLCQTTDGFVNIDCGNVQNYTDPSTNFVYTPDDQYIDTGTIFDIKDNYKTKIHYHTDLNLRSFPNGDRNCYTLKPAVKSNMYLIRATFFYGNYDGFNSIKSNSPILFDLHIGVNYWRRVNVSDATATYENEAITVALANFLSVCLINTGHGTPFINSLEMRPLKTSVYPSVSASQFTDLYRRIDFGGSEITRYPNDKYDRIWYPEIGDWTSISTSQKVNRNNFFEPPSSVLQTAVLPSKLSPNPWSLVLNWTTEDANPPFYANLHFTEIQSLPSNGKREFDIFFNGDIWGHLILEYLVAHTAYTPTQLLTKPASDNKYEFWINATSDSTVPPLINGLEIFSMLQVENAMTDLADVEAILAIKTKYKVNKSWSGDPCAPVNYTWAGIGCNRNASGSQIIFLNLSSSGLTGSLSSSFSNLQNIRILDLSNNKLNGEIPDFLSNMESLRVLNLSCNSFSGSVPDALKVKSNAGLLTLKNDNTCSSIGSESNSKKSPIAVIVAVVVVVTVVVVVLLFVLFLIFWKRKPRSEVPSPIPVKENEISIHELQLKTRKYTKQELETITNNFRSEIGGGGFGIVFAGILNNGIRVAVKRLSETSNQGLKQFRTEAESLATLRHKNLVYLVGYCEDESCVALVYEYMSRGSLEDHIKGNQDHGKGLSWKERLHVVLEAAQGLDYLHKGGRVPIVHRDVKSSNILLGSNLETKVSDLGLARAFSSSTQAATVPTVICGTRGYIDPEYYSTGMLTEKSDVYGFGVVLMEIITGQPSVVKTPKGDANLSHYIKEKTNREDMTSLIDNRFQGNYDMNSVCKVMELALYCTHDKSEPRPTMAQVVAELVIIKDTNKSGIGRTESVYSEGSNIDYNNGFGDQSDMFGPSTR